MTPTCSFYSTPTPSKLFRGPIDSENWCHPSSHTIPYCSAWWVTISSYIVLVLLLYDSFFPGLLHTFFPWLAYLCYQGCASWLTYATSFQQQPHIHLFSSSAYDPTSPSCISRTPPPLPQVLRQFTPISFVLLDFTLRWKFEVFSTRALLPCGSGAGSVRHPVRLMANGPGHCFSSGTALTFGCLSQIFQTESQ